MANWIDQVENQGTGGTFNLLIDDDYFFLIDFTNKLIISDGAAPVGWTDQNES